MSVIDINCDLGEGFGRWTLTEDDALLSVVTSANVACGFHAGDPVTLRRVCAAAVARGVSVGAQVSFRDLVGFGRRRIECSPDELAADVLYQLGAVSAFCAAAGDRVRYVKPHGALYHELAADTERASAVATAIAAFDRDLAVLAPPGSALLTAAESAGLRPVAEGFPDRGYSAAGSLVARASPGALVTAAVDVAARAVAMAVEHRVVAVDGTAVSLAVESLCIHGDGAGAVAAASAVRAALEAAGCSIRPFA